MGVNTFRVLLCQSYRCAPNAHRVASRQRHLLRFFLLVLLLDICFVSHVVVRPVHGGATVGIDNPSEMDAPTVDYGIFSTQAIYLLNTSFLQNRTAYGASTNYDSESEALVSFWFAICADMGPFEYVTPFHTVGPDGNITNVITPLSNSKLDGLISMWCPTGSGTTLQSPIFWSTSAPPGVYNYTSWESMSITTTFMQCSATQNVPLDSPLIHSSDDTTVLYPGASLYPLVQPWSTATTSRESRESNYSAIAARTTGLPENFFFSGFVGGLGTGSMCAGARFSTFVLSLASSPKFILQMRTLRMTYIAPMALTNSHEVQCGNVDGCVSRSSQCVMQLMNAEYSGLFSESGEWIQDGGLFFEMFITMCNESLSETVSRSTAQLLRQGFNGIIASAPSVYNKLAMPSELIEAVLSWISASRGNWQDSLFDSTSCFVEKEEERAYYLSGYVTVCNISAQMAGGMPTLYLTLSSRQLLSVRTYEMMNYLGDIIMGEVASPSTGCTIGIDLNTLVDPDSFQLRLHSSGSMDNFLRQRSWTREPLVVIGAGLLQSATIATTRDYFPEGNDTNTDFIGLPVMMLTAGYPFLKNSEMANSTALMCVARLSCAPSQMYYNAINKCGATWCIGSITVPYQSSTLQCKLSVPWLVAAILLLAVVGFCEVVLIFIRNRVRREILSGVSAVAGRSAGAGNAVR